VVKVEGGAASVIAGSGTPGRNDGPALTAQLRSPGGIAVDSSGNVYIADTGNNAIRLLDTNERLSTLIDSTTLIPAAGGQALNQPSGLVWFNGKLYIADTGNNRVLVLTLPN
jgi:DNA-binding beta-propeller fold protein YncE